MIDRISLLEYVTPSSTTYHGVSCHRFFFLSLYLLSIHHTPVCCISVMGIRIERLDCERIPFKSLKRVLKNKVPSCVV